MASLLVVDLECVYCWCIAGVIVSLGNCFGICFSVSNTLHSFAPVIVSVFVDMHESFFVCVGVVDGCSLFLEGGGRDGRMSLLVR